MINVRQKLETKLINFYQPHENVNRRGKKSHWVLMYRSYLSHDECLQLWLPKILLMDVKIALKTEEKE